MTLYKVYKVDNSWDGGYRNIRYYISKKEAKEFYTRLKASKDPYSYPIIEIIETFD